MRTFAFEAASTLRASFRSLRPAWRRRETDFGLRAANGVQIGLDVRHPLCVGHLGHGSLPPSDRVIHCIAFCVARTRRRAVPGVRLQPARRSRPATCAGKRGRPEGRPVFLQACAYRHRNLMSEVAPLQRSCNRAADHCRRIDLPMLDAPPRTRRPAPIGDRADVVRRQTVRDERIVQEQMRRRAGRRHTNAMALQVARSCESCAGRRCDDERGVRNGVHGQESSGRNGLPLRPGSPAWATHQPRRHFRRGAPPCLCCRPPTSDTVSESPSCW